MTQQVSSSQLSGLPSGKQLTAQTLSDLNVQLAEAGTQQLVGQALFHLKDFPNPELVSQAVNIGATQDVATALQDPSLGQYMTITPGNPNAKPPGPDNGPGLPGADMDTFDWNAYWQNQSQMLSDNPSYRGLGGVPQMNIAWMNGTMSNSGPKGTVKWQQWLIDHGVLDKRHPADGHWDDATRTAFTQYMQMLAMPDALYSKDPQRQAQANAFLDRLGIDTAAMHKSEGSNPTFQRDVVLAWMQTQQPGHQADSLHDFANRFGFEHLTQAEQKIATPSLIDTIMGGIETLTHLSNPNQMIAQAIGIFNPDASTALLQGLAKPDYRVQHAADLAAQLQAEGMTPQEQAALSPALLQVQNSTGFLPFEWWDQKKAEVLLSVGYTLMDPLTGHGLTNPFDSFNPNSDLGKRIGAHQDNLASAIFGADFLKQHASLATMTNLVANTLDDPLTYFGGAVMRAPKLGRDLAAAAKGGEILDPATGLGARASFGEAGQAAMQRFLHPKAEAERVMAHGIFATKESLSTMYKALRITDHTLAGATAPRMQAAVNRIVNAQSVDEVRAELHGTFSHNMHTPAFLLNARDALEAFSQTVLKSRGEQHALSMRTMGGFRDTGLALEVRLPIKSMRTLEQSLKIAGMPNKEISKLMDEWLKVPEAERTSWIDEHFVQELEQAIKTNFPGTTLEQAVAWAKDMKKGRSYVVHPAVEEELGPNVRVKQAKYQPAQPGETAVDPETGKPFAPGTEMSRAPRNFPPATQQWITRHQDAADALQDGWKEAVNEGAKKIIQSDPTVSVYDAIARFRETATGRELEAEKDTQLARIAQAVNEIAPEGLTRPMPGSEGQLSAKAMLPVTPYELYTFLSHGMFSTHTMEEVAAHLRADAFYSIWKGIALARPSTALRVMIGDDTTRFLVEMATAGHPAAAIRAFLQSSGLGAYAGFGNALMGAMEHAPGLSHVAEGLQTTRFSPRAAVTRARRLGAAMGYADTMTIAKALNEVDDSVMHTFYPEVAHPDAYLRGFRDWFRANWANSPTNQEWAQVRYGTKGELTAKYGSGDSAALAYLKDVAAGKIDRPGIQHIISTKQVEAEQWAQTQHQYLLSVTSNRELLRMGAKGQVSANLGKLYKANVKSFPIISAPRPNVFSKNFMVRALKNGPQSMFRAVAEPMIATARAEGGWALKQMYEKHIEREHPDWTAEEVASLASDQATHWMEDNLYNGQRTLLGRSLRHVFPFDGATANMSRFYVRQLQMHPWLGPPLARFANYEEQQASSNQDTSMLFNHNILSALGFGGSDAMFWNPSHSFFLTADGLASFLPGVGPIFTPVLSFVANDQALRDELSVIPGLREQLQFAAGRSTGANPLSQALSAVIPSWLSNQVDALGLISPLHSPLIGIALGQGEDYKRRMDTKAKQLYGDYLSGKRNAAPTADDVTASVGADLLAAGVVGDVLPVMPSVVDERARMLKTFQAQYTAANTPAKQKAVLDATRQAGKDSGFDVTPLLLYYDPRTSLDEQDRIKNDNQWIVPYTTTMYEAKGPRPSTLSEYDAAIARGDLHALGLGEFIPQVSNEVQSAYLWVKYQQIKNAQSSFLQANGLTTASPEYRDFLASTVNPALQSLEQQGQSSGWTDRFLKQTATNITGLTAGTAPIRSVMTWHVLPITADLENGTSIAWRKAIINVKEAASTLAAMRAEGGSKADEQTILDGLDQQLQGIAQTNAAFSADLQHFSFRRFEDVVNLGVQEQAPNYGAAYASG